MIETCLLTFTQTHTPTTHHTRTRTQAVGNHAHRRRAQAERGAHQQGQVRTTHNPSPCHPPSMMMMMHLSRTNPAYATGHGSLSVRLVPEARGASGRGCRAVNCTALPSPFFLQHAVPIPMCHTPAPHQPRTTHTHTHTPQEEEEEARPRGERGRRLRSSRGQLAQPQG